ncbi:MAG: aminotransferase class I/II-fold pyridoxal phosphate-dependent enzyme, partial [Myxococcales bacterium]|nr:aminotransferase class I/II-fold pyridoxal phosphate-dependent enzyme [Myxococcales bacterium]
MVDFSQLLHEQLAAIEPYAPPFADRSAVNLALNEHPLPPPPAVQALLAEVDGARLVGYDTERSQALTERLAEREGVGPENILLCAGESQALASLIASLRRSELLYPEVCWSYFHTLATLHGHSIRRYPIARDHGRGFTIELPALLAEARRGAPSLVLFINPHMPLGFLTARARIEACAAELSDTLVLVDEAYAGFSAAFESMAPRVREVPNLIVAKTFSKYFGLASARVGYLVADAALVAELRKAESPFRLSYLSASIALVALDEEESYRRYAAEVMATMERFRARTNATPGARALPTAANFVLVEFADVDAAERVQAR